MPKRNAVASLPREVKAWLDKALAEGGFQKYRVLEDELRARGYAISKSTLQRYGAAFEERLSSLRMATEQAKAVVEASPDREGATNEALMRLVQEQLFGLLINLQDDEKKNLNLPKIAKAIADLCRAAVTQKRFSEEVREQAKREMREEMNQKIHALGSAADLKALSDDELEARIAALACEV